MRGKSGRTKFWGIRGCFMTLACIILLVFDFVYGAYVVLVNGSRQHPDMLEESYHS